MTVLTVGYLTYKSQFLYIDVRDLVCCLYMCKQVVTSYCIIVPFCVRFATIS
jgi:hypothetical protein